MSLKYMMTYSYLTAEFLHVVSANLTGVLNQKKTQYKVNFSIYSSFVFQLQMYICHKTQYVCIKTATKWKAMVHIAMKI